MYCKNEKNTGTWPNVIVPPPHTQNPNYRLPCRVSESYGSGLAHNKTVTITSWPMPNLVFKFGSMAAAKSLELLVTCFQYEAAGKRPCLIKPAVDTRQPGLIWSRVPGMERKADLEIREGDLLSPNLAQEFDVLLVDESHWLSKELVDQLYALSTQIPVVCYGLRTDFQQRLFPGSAALFALADEIVEIQGLCRFCHEPAAHNLRVSTKPPPLDGSNVEPGADETFVPACKSCYNRRKL